MTVRELIDALENFDENMEVRIGMVQNYGTNFAMNICDNVEEHKISSFYGSDYNAVVITEGNQVGAVDYDDDEEFEDEDSDDDEEEEY